jgi:hypothetical protein
MDEPVPPAGPAPAAPPQDSGMSALSAEEMARARMSKKTVEREQEMKKVAELGRKRFEREFRKERKAAAKGYRKDYRQREKEILADKQRKEKIRQEMEAKAKERAEQRKKESAYMGALHEQAQIKREAELKVLRREELRDQRTRAEEHRFRAEIEKLDHEFSKSMEEATVAMQARKVVIDNNAKQKRYALENWRRMRLSALEGEMRNKMIAACSRAHGALEIERIKGDVQAQYRPRFKALEKEFVEKGAEIDMEVRFLKTAAENDMKTAHLRAEETLRQAPGRTGARQAPGRHRAGSQEEEISRFARRRACDTLRTCRGGGIGRRISLRS